jgi:hypothetical protein
LIDPSSPWHDVLMAFDEIASVGDGMAMAWDLQGDEGGGRRRWRISAGGQQCRRQAGRVRDNGENDDDDEDDNGRGGEGGGGK